MYLTSMVQRFYLIYKLQSIRKKLLMNIAILRNFNENSRVRTKKILPYILKINGNLYYINLRYISL